MVTCVVVLVLPTAFEARSVYVARLPAGSGRTFTEWSGPENTTAPVSSVTVNVWAATAFHVRFVADPRCTVPGVATNAVIAGGSEARTRAVAVVVPARFVTESVNVVSWETVTSAEFVAGETATGGGGVRAMLRTFPAMIHVSETRPPGATWKGVE